MLWVKQKIYEYGWEKEIFWLKVSDNYTHKGDVTDTTGQQGEGMGRGRIVNHQKYQSTNQTSSASYVWGRLRTIYIEQTRSKPDPKKNPKKYLGKGYCR